MPVRRELRHFYGRTWREVTRPAILTRAGHQCERCGVRNYDVGYREPSGFFRPVPIRKRRAAGKLIRIVLGVAHLNHVAGDDRPENLAALCQRCHLMHDQNRHHETRAARKDLARPLLAVAPVTPAEPCGPEQPDTSSADQVQPDSVSV